MKWRFKQYLWFITKANSSGTQGTMNEEPAFGVSPCTNAHPIASVQEGSELVRPRVTGWKKTSQCVSWGHRPPSSHLERGGKANMHEGEFVISVLFFKLCTTHKEMESGYSYSKYSINTWLILLQHRHWIPWGVKYSTVKYSVLNSQIRPQSWHISACKYSTLETDCHG